MVYIIKRPLLLGNLENFPDTNNNGRFEVLNVYFL